MSLEEFIKSDIEITYENLEANGISLAIVKKGVSGITKEEGERYLKTLLILESKNPFDNKLKFMIMRAYIMKRNYNAALDYARYIYHHERNYKSDYLTYMYLLRELTGETVEELKYVKKQDLCVHQYDVRFTSTYSHNRMRNYIFDKNYKKVRQILYTVYNTEMNDCEKVLNKLVLAVSKKEEKALIGELIKCIENNNFNKLRDYYASFKTTNEKIELEKTLLNMLIKVHRGIALPQPKEKPKDLTIYKAVETFNIDAALNTDNREIVDAYLRKIKEENQYVIEGNYEGVISPLLDATIEVIYNYIKDYDFESSEKVLKEYLVSTYKTDWTDILITKLNTIKDNIVAMTKKELLLSLADLFDSLVEISRSNTPLTEKYIKDRYNGVVPEVHPYSKIHKIDIEYNYGIKTAGKLRQAVSDGTIDFKRYIDKEEITENDLFKLAIIAREHYRIGKMDTGTLIISLTKDLSKKAKYKSSELKFFLDALYENKDIIKNSEIHSFTDTVKMLVRD